MPLVFFVNAGLKLPKKPYFVIHRNVTFFVNPGEVAVVAQVRRCSS